MFKVLGVDTQLKDTPDNPMPHAKKEMERAKSNGDTKINDIYEVKLQTLNFNKESLRNKAENIKLIRKEMSNILENLKTTGLFIIKDTQITNRQIIANQLLES